MGTRGTTRSPCQEWQVTLLVTVVLPFLLFVPPAYGMSHYKRHKLREEVRQMFYHAYEGYLDHAFPADELMPQSCKGRWRFPNGHQEHRGTLDDGFGNYSLTLVDTLDTLVVMEDMAEFERAVGLVTSTVDFNRDVTINLFETTIRTLGGLLSAHILAERHLSGDSCTDLHLSTNPLFPSDGDCSGYKHGQRTLLDLAVDLADRLLPAFKTPTGIPYSRVNLKYGVPRGETTATCLAGAGTLLLEFGTLSRLTSNPKYEEVAARALHALWERREPRTDLMGGLIDVNTGKWLESSAGIGAGSDSFYEYLLKSYILFGESSYLHMFNKSYDAIKRYMKQGDWYLDVHMHTGSVVGSGVDSLQAFFPGVQVLTGDITSAVEMHSTFYSLWKRYGYLPESFNVKHGHPPRHLYKGYPLRPEFIESTLMLYHATQDSFYLEVGEQILRDLQRTKTACGFAAVADVETGRLEDRMDSYFLSETCKYLYLLFDEDNHFIRAPNFVFSTEAHILPIFSSSPSWSHVHSRVEGSSSAKSSKQSPTASTSLMVLEEARPTSINTCAAINVTGRRSRTTNTTAVLEAMFAEYRKNQRRIQMERHSADDPGDAMDAEAKGKILDNILEQVKSSMGINEPKLKIEAKYTVILWGVPFNIFTAPDLIHHQGNIILSAEEHAENIPRDDGDDVEVHNSGVQDKVEVLAVQALFGPFFSSFIGKPFELIYVPHELCPDQDFAMHVEDSYGRVIMVPRGQCQFAEKAMQLAKFHAGGMLVYNTNPKEGPLEMTGPNMDIPVPSAMLSYNDSLLLKQALRRAKDGVLRMNARAQEQPRQHSAAETDMVVDMDALTQNLQHFFMSQHGCGGAACLQYINPAMPIVVDTQSVPMKPAEHLPWYAQPGWSPDPAEAAKNLQQVSTECEAPQQQPLQQHQYPQEEPHSATSLDSEHQQPSAQDAEPSPQVEDEKNKKGPLEVTPEQAKQRLKEKKERHSRKERRVKDRDEQRAAKQSGTMSDVEHKNNRKKRPRRGAEQEATPKARESEDPQMTAMRSVFEQARAREQAVKARLRRDHDEEHP